jgi:hypothetical protein
MNDVLYVLGINKKLLSMGAIINKGCVVIFGSQKCWIIMSLPTKFIIEGKHDKFNGLYKLGSSNQ